MGRPSLAELRAVAQPPEHMARYNAEHWAGPLYLRHGSLHVTRWLVGTRVTANGVTMSMIVIGVLGAAALPVDGIWGPLIAFLAIQLQMLLDCSDGEIARWHRTFSPAGMYLDRVAHYCTEAALPIALGLRADDVGPGHWRPGGWTTCGLLVAVLALLNKAFTDLVHVSRYLTGRPKADDVASITRSRRSGLAAVRSALRFFPVFRSFIAIEATMLALAAGAYDASTGSLDGTHTLLRVLVPLAFVTAGGHLLGVVSSDRIR